MKKAEILRNMETVIAEGPYSDTWQSLCGHKTPEWYRRAKFGIFIHWGVYSVPAFGNEWYPRNMYIQSSPEFEHHVKRYGSQKEFGYKDFIPMFRGERFDAAEWMRLFKEAGARYVMPVAEHHDGFQMYESELSKWNAKNMGPCRDIVGELKKAADEEGIVFSLSNHRAEHCWFFNGGLHFESDISDPAYEDFYWRQQADAGKETHDIYSAPPSTAHCEDWLARVCEMVDKYRPQIVWFDWWIQNVGFTPYLKKFAAFYYNRAVQWGVEVSINYKYRAFAYGSATYDVERGQLAGIRPELWQTDTAIARNSWGYTKDNDFKCPTDLVCDLVDIVSKNGCLLLNVGPKPNGEITDEEKSILRSIGRWLSTNGEGIYDTAHWEVFGEGPNNAAQGSFTDGAPVRYTSEDIRFTYRDAVLYAFIMRFPENGEITIKSLRRDMKGQTGDLDIQEISILGYRRPVAYRRDEEALHLQVHGRIETEYPVCFKILLG